MTASQVLWYYLWIMPHVLQVILLFGMVRRRLHRQFPMFLLYTGFEVLQFCVLFALFELYASNLDVGEQYLRVHAVGLALSAALRFGIISEVVSQIFRRYPVLSGPGKVLLRGATLVLLLIAAALAVAAPGSSADFLWVATQTGDRSVIILQCGLLVSLFLFARYLGISWRSYVFGIAVGLGIFASVELATSAMLLYVVPSTRFFDFLTMGSYHCCVLVWMFYLLAPERSPQYTVKALPNHELDVWNKELKRLLQQ